MSSSSKGREPECQELFIIVIKIWLLVCDVSVGGLLDKSAGQGVAREEARQGSPTLHSDLIQTSHLTGLTIRF